MKNRKMYRYTIWTAAYNAESTIHRTYKSLESQSFKDFEWIVVNDGSVDGTAKVLEDIKEQASFPLHVINKENGGKHTALREAAKVAHGQYVVIIDSDDELLPDALSIFDKYWKELENTPQYDSFWQIKGQCIDETGKPMGPKLPKEPYFDSDYNLIQFKYKNKSEMECASKYEVMVNEAAVPNHFIFEDKCSNFGEGIRWSRAARKYKTRFISDVVRIYHRDVIGSLTASNKKQRSMKHTYNLFVYELYGIKERRDLMLKYDLKSYISTLLALSYHSLCTGVSLNSGATKLFTNVTEKIVCALFKIPLFIVLKIRK